MQKNSAWQSCSGLLCVSTCLASWHFIYPGLQSRFVICPQTSQWLLFDWLQESHSCLSRRIEPVAALWGGYGGGGGGGWGRGAACIADGIINEIT